MCPFRETLITGEISGNMAKQPIEVMPALISMSDMVVGGITDFEN
jgi:hypothetical protein